MPKNLKDLEQAELKKLAVALGEPAFGGTILFNWLQAKAAAEGGLTEGGFFAGFFQKTFIFNDKTLVEAFADLPGPVIGFHFKAEEAALDFNKFPQGADLHARRACGKVFDIQLRAHGGKTLGKPILYRSYGGTLHEGDHGRGGVYRETAASPFSRENPASWSKVSRSSSSFISLSALSVRTVFA